MFIVHIFIIKLFYLKIKFLKDFILNKKTILLSKSLQHVGESGEQVCFGHPVVV